MRDKAGFLRPFPRAVLDPGPSLVTWLLPTGRTGRTVHIPGGLLRILLPCLQRAKERAGQQGGVRAGLSYEICGSPVISEMSQEGHTSQREDVSPQTPAGPHLPSPPCPRLFACALPFARNALSLPLNCHHELLLGRLPCPIIRDTDHRYRDAPLHSSCLLSFCSAF